MAAAAAATSPGNQLTATAGAAELSRDAPGGWGRALGAGGIRPDASRTRGGAPSHALALRRAPGRGLRVCGGSRELGAGSGNSGRALPAAVGGRGRCSGGELLVRERAACSPEELRGSAPPIFSRSLVTSPEESVCLCEEHSRCSFAPTPRGPPRARQRPSKAPPRLAGGRRGRFGKYRARAANFTSEGPD